MSLLKKEGKYADLEKDTPTYFKSHGSLIVLERQKFIATKQHILFPDDLVVNLVYSKESAVSMESMGTLLRKKSTQR